MNPHVKLFTPGPGDVDEDILAEMGSPVLRHYGPSWMPIYNDTQDLLHKIFKTKNDIFIVPGPASALLDMGIGSVVPAGGKVIVGSNGFFGDRLGDMANAHGLVVVPFTAPMGQPLDPDGLRDLINQNPDTVAVALVHHETSTTVMNPLKELAKIVHEAGMIMIVDAVSSLAGVDVQTDNWHLDICVSSANKCLEALPGVSFISVSKEAWQLVDSHPGVTSGWYLNLRLWRKFAQEWGSWHPSPVTLPSNLILAARAAMHKIVDRGLDAHFDRYRNASRVMRTGLTNLGFEMTVPDAFASPIATGVNARADFDLADMVKFLAEERNIAIGGGLGALSGKMFRVGHLGKAAERDYMLDFLFSMEEFLRSKNIAIPTGGGLAALLEK